MLYLVLTLASVLVICFVLYRLLPALRGKVTRRTAHSVRWYRWNTYVSPHIQKYLETRLLVASISSFQSKPSNVQLSLFTCSLHPTVVSYVDFIAIANPDSLEGEASILGFIAATDLREILGGIPEGEPILGHRVWTYVWPETADRDVLEAALLLPNDFRKRHGLNLVRDGKGEMS